MPLCKTNLNKQQCVVIDNIGLMDCAGCMAYIGRFLISPPQRLDFTRQVVKERPMEFRKRPLRAFGGSETSNTILDVSGACFILFPSNPHLTFFYMSPALALI